jgi:hypothetical protein
MAKLPTINSTYTPKEIEFVNSAGEIVPNSDLPLDERVRVELTFATIGQRERYTQVFSQMGDGESDLINIKTLNEYDVALKKHIVSIENLEDENGKRIKNGVDLINCKNPFLNDFKQDLFLRICGTRVDDPDGPGELSTEKK